MSKVADWSNDATLTGIIVTFAICTIACLFSFFVAIFPGEWIYNTPATNAFYSIIRENGKRLEVPLYRQLFEGKFDIASARRESLFTNTLIVTPSKALYEKTKLFNGLYLRGRNFQSAAFLGLDLSNADFTGSFLSDSLFYQTTLDGAKFDCSEIVNPKIYSSDLHDKPTWPDSCAWLNGAIILESSLKGASFHGIRGRWLIMFDSKVQGAAFDDANLQASSFLVDDLTGATFKNASLTSSIFISDVLNVVDFDYAQLVGTYISWSSIDATSMVGVHVAASDINLQNIQVSRVSAISDQNDLFDSENDPRYVVWKSRILEDKPKDRLVPMLSDLNHPEMLDKLVISRYPEYDKAFNWSELNEKFGFNSDGTDDVRLNRYLAEAVEISCRSNGAPYVARNIIGYKQPVYIKNVIERLFRADEAKSPSLLNLVEKRKGDPNSCPGMKEIFEAWPIAYTPTSN